MKDNMKYSLLRRFCLLFGYVILLVSCSSCADDDFDAIGHFPVDDDLVYFHIQGTVSSGGTTALGDVRVVTKFCFDDIGAVAADTVYTDGNGQFESYGIAYSDSMRVVADGFAMGSASDSVDIRLQLVQYSDPNIGRSFYVYEGTANFSLNP